MTDYRQNIDPLDNTIFGLTRLPDNVSFLIPRAGESEARFVDNPDYQRYKTDSTNGQANILASINPKITSDNLEVNPRTVRTTNAASTEIGRFLVNAKSLYRVVFELNGISIDGVDTYYRQVIMIIKRVTTTPVIAGSAQVVAPITSNAGSNWSSSAVVFGNELVVSVGGQVGKTIDWELRLDVVLFTPEGK